jgi:ribosomal protein S18 acetylase RimI-like enzyme
LSCWIVKSIIAQNFLAETTVWTTIHVSSLAVDNNFQGQGLGEVILIDAFKKALDATKQVASLALVVEAIDENAVRFYQKYGFLQFKQHPNRLYLSMKSIASVLSTL